MRMRCRGDVAGSGGGYVGSTAWPPGEELETARGQGGSLVLKVSRVSHRDEDDDRFLRPRLLTEVRGRWSVLYNL